MQKHQQRIIVLSALGGMLEFYDFTIYGLFAVYFAAQFFPMTDHFAGLIATYSIFLIGYVVRPLGGIIFSHIGDEYGRKKVLILTMVLMGAASFGLGFLPTYASIGLWAPILMATLRLLQGLAIGGELPSMIVYAAETIPEQRGRALGIVFAGALFGLVPGMLLNMIMTHVFTVDQLNAFGWRLPFILGGILCVVAYQVRRKLQESLAFTHLKQHDRFPLRELLQHHFGKLMIGIGVASIIATTVMLVLIFMPTYLGKILSIPMTRVTNVVLFAMLVSVATTYFSGVLADKMSQYQLMSYCLAGIIVGGALCYYALSHGVNLYIALFLFAVFHGSLVSVPVILLSEIFPIQIRLTGVALSYNLAFVLFAGLLPIVVTSFIERTQQPYLMPFLWLVGVAVIAFVATQALSRVLSR